MGRGVLVPGLRRCRVLRAMTQEELAERTGINRNTISRLESGIVAKKPRGADFATIRKLATALGVEPAELMRAEEARRDT